MAVLMRLWGWFSAYFDSLLRAGMKAGKAGCTVRTNASLLIHSDITHRAYALANTATDTLILVHQGGMCVTSIAASDPCP